MSVSQRVPMTPRGHAMLQEEFKRLKNVERPQIVKEIEERLERFYGVRGSFEQLIEDALASYGVEAKVVQINAGPTVTQFGVEPGFVTGRSTSRPPLRPEGWPRWRRCRPGA